MPRPSIEQVRQMGDFLTLYRWDVEIIPPNGITLPSREKMNFRCETSTIPHLNDQPIEVTVRGHKVRQPGIHMYDNTYTLQFVETVDVVVHEFIRNWREALWQVKTGISVRPKNELQGTVILRQLNNQDQAVWEYKLIGVFPETYDLGTLDGASSDAQKPTITFSYDYFEDKKLA